MEDWNDGMVEEWVRVSTPWKIFRRVFHAMEKSFPHRGKSPPRFFHAMENFS
jgi:hypothetical protein